MNKPKRTASLLALILFCAAAFAAGYLFRGTDPAGETSLEEHTEHGLKASTNEKGETVWTCSMHPQIQLPSPGQCPICFMDLIPLKKKDEGEQTSLRQIRLSDEARKLAGITVEEVRRMDVAVETRMVGKVDYDETRVRTITAWTGGRIDKMHVDYTGSPVRRGQPMVSIYSPELLTAQAELIQAIKAARDLEKSTLSLVKESAMRTRKAAREKLRLLGLTDRQIEAIVNSGTPSDHITLYAPQGGVVIRKDVNEGQYVKTGSPIYAIADLSSLWVILEAYESDLPWIRIGQEVDFSTEAYPGKRFQGKVVYIDPVVNEKSRTVRVRLEVPNRDGSLKPGMLVRAVQQKKSTDSSPDGNPLVIPASAPLITGKRAVVYVADKNDPGTYRGREIVLGPKAGQYYIVKNGLEPGELVVTKGNFKIDSAIQIVARPSMMNPAIATTQVAEAELPSLFLSKLRLLGQTFASLKPVVANGDLAQAHLAFGRFHKELRLVEDSDLEDETALQWKEYAMLLGNDAMLASEARRPRND
ncbi:efflux RND transporter periplasmic adaptor subunit [Pseudodesulfovibrio tunisiensis]|uniref:efflux RND transporter periplasmic adaptor subunit n=1 Tax=Pseudodesulfovibrio tunisiensis TaxID=463192 RepID=UPI001FB1F476|nr:efflux RND transporter periplasmic adaptor subunit [Pseudodesulfovibrio tunisiensis]